MAEKQPLLSDEQIARIRKEIPKTFHPKTCVSCGKEFTPTSANQKNCGECRANDEIRKRINRERDAEKRAKAAKKEHAQYQQVSSKDEVSPKEAREILSGRGIRHSHVIDFCTRLAESAARVLKLPFNHYLLNHGLRAALGQTTLPEIADEEVEGEILYRRDLHALWDYGFWRQPDVTFEQWLADRRRLKSSTFEMSRLLGKEDFGPTHKEWESFLPHWNPVGLHPNYTQREALSWLGDQRSDTEVDKRRFLLVCSRNAMKSTWVRILALQLTLTCPDAPLLIVSETNKLSRKAMREFRGYLELQPLNPTLFQQYFGEYTVATDDGSSLTYENPLAHLGLPQIACESSSMESANTGSRFWLCLFDDPISRDNGTGNEDQRAAALSKWGAIMRLREPAGYAINIQTPWEPSDLGAAIMKANDADPDQPFGVRIDPVMQIKPEARGKRLLDLTEDDVTLNFLPKLNWRFIRGEMRSPEGLNFFRTQYMCEWVDEDSYIRMQFDEAVLRSKFRPRSFFDATALPGLPVYISLDRAFSKSAKADFSSIAVVRVQPVGDKLENALVVLDVVFNRWKESELIENICKVIEKHKPVAWVFEKDKSFEELILGVRKQCFVRNLVMPHVILRDVKNTPQAKAAKIKILEAPLESNRLWFVAGPFMDATIAQFVRFDGVKKSGGSDGSKDDIPDSVATAYSVWGPRAEIEPLNPEEQLERSRIEEEAAAEIRKRAHYDRMFGPRAYTPPPTPQLQEVEPPKTDPRLKVFGNRGPWRL